MRKLHKNWLPVIGVVVFLFVILGYRQLKNPSFSMPFTDTDIATPYFEEENQALMDPQLCQERMNSLKQQVLVDNGLLEKQDLTISHPEIARRNGDTLEIGPKAKPVHKLENKNGTTFETFVQYDTHHYFPDSGFVLIHYKLYEGDGYALLSMKGGDISIPSVPYFSPGKKYFAVINPGDETGYNWTGVQIYANNDGKFAKEFEQELNIHNSLTFIKWLDDEKIEVAQNTGQGSPVRISQLAKVNGVWILQTGTEWIAGCEPLAAKKEAVETEN